MDSHDYFGLSDISDIQEDIEIELKNKSSDNFSALFIVQEEEQPAVSLEKPQEIVDISPADFYRETIKETPRKTFTAAAVFILVLCTVGMGALGFGIGSGFAVLRGNSSSNAAQSQTAGNNPENTSLVGTSYIFETVETEHTVATLSDMVELIAPSIVSITTHLNEASFPFAQTRSGSGIIFDASDDRIFIATSLYVVSNGHSWYVSIDGSEPISAMPVGLDRRYDLAVAYIYKEQLWEAGIDSLSYATFGDSDNIRVGEDVMAIGNAMGEGTSVTRGIISAAERPIYLPHRTYPLMLLQTDAAINYGNSGGPLINTRGEIIGININHTGILGSSAHVEGMSFSISSNSAVPVLERIIANYRIPSIGIEGGDLANDEENRAAYWGIPPLGVLVGRVVPGRPAEAAGIRQFDVITAFDGQPIFDFTQLREAILAREIGDIVEIRVLRNGTQAITLQLELAIMQRDNFDTN